MSFIFKITTTTSPQTFVIPCVNVGTFNATVDYGDGTGSQTVTAYNDSNLTHSFATAGQYTITIDGTFPNVRFNDNAASREALDEVVDLGDVGWVNFFRAFRDCTNLTAFNVGTADTSSVTTMQEMFLNCTSLTTLDVSNFDTSSNTNMAAMFYSCSSLTALDLSSFDTSSVTNMYLMFNGCSNLTSLDVSNFDTSSVTDISRMFLNCTSLTNLDIKHFDISSVTNGTSFLQGANNALTTTAYDELLEAWAAQDVQPNVAWHFGNAQYTVVNIADWYSPRGASSLSIINNKLVSIADSTATFGVAQQIDNLIVGNSYKIIGTATCSNSSAEVYIRASTNSALSGTSGQQDFSTNATGSATANNIFIATATTLYVGNVVSGNDANDTVTIDAGITVKEITNYTEANAASEIEYSQENVFGSEEVVNGDFSDGLTGWVGVSSILSSPSSNLNVQNNGALFGRADQNITGLVIGATYVIEAGSVSTLDGIPAKMVLGTTSLIQGSGRMGSLSFFFTATSTTHTLQLLNNDNTSNKSVVWDDVSIREITNAVTYQNIAQDVRDTYTLVDGDWLGDELVVNGDFATDSDWTKGTGWTISGGKAKLDSDGLYKSLKQDILTVGSYYEIELDVTEFITGALVVKCGTGTDVNISSVGHKKVTVQATNSKFELLNVQAVTQCSIDNVSVKRLIQTV